MRELPTPTIDLSPTGMPAMNALALQALRGSLHRPSAKGYPISPAGQEPRHGVGQFVADASTHDSGNAAQPEAALEVVWASNLGEVRAAQRLRYQVFGLEMGAKLASPVPEHDIDEFDDYCEHLIVRLAGTQEVMGTYRLLTPAQARRIGRTYTDGEFDLSALEIDRSQTVELGRSCVHPEYRSGAVILALWGGLVEFMARNGLSMMMGCASIPMIGCAASRAAGLSGSHVAASIWHRLDADHLYAKPYPAAPRLALPVKDLHSEFAGEPPALIKAYLRMGAKVLGPPAWDPDFNTADLPMLMRVGDLPRRYRRQFGALI